VILCCDFSQATRLTIGVLTDLLDRITTRPGEASQGPGLRSCNKSIDGKPLRIASKQFTRVLGTHAESGLFDEPRRAISTISASVGIDDEIQADKTGRFRVDVVPNGKTLGTNAAMAHGDAAHGRSRGSCGKKARNPAGALPAGFGG
jgi:hypothetical protein